MADELKDMFYGWVLHSMKSTLEDEDIRNLILREQLKGFPYYHLLVFGKTFEGKKTEINKYLKSIIKNDDKIHLFTIFNLPDLDTSETHFQSFVLINNQKKIIAIDPARTKEGCGIYRAFASEDLKAYIEKHTYYNFEWYVATNTCQSQYEFKFRNKTYDEVYCQTWSLYLQLNIVKQLLSNKSYIVEIPPNINDKIKILENFFKTVILYEPIQEKLRDEYIISLKGSIDEETDILYENKKEYEKLSDANPIKKQVKNLIKELYDSIQESHNSLNNLNIISREDPVEAINKITVFNFYT